MWKNNRAPEISELHRRLEQVLPDYALISTRNDSMGTFKSVDSSGAVWLVTWIKTKAGWTRRKQKYCDYDALLRMSSAG